MTELKTTLQFETPYTLWKDIVGNTEANKDLMRLPMCGKTHDFQGLRLPEADLEVLRLPELDLNVWRLLVGASQQWILFFCAS